MAIKIGLTDAELKAVQSSWAIVMGTNIAETCSNLLLTCARYSIVIDLLVVIYYCYNLKSSYFLISLIAIIACLSSIYL